MTTEDSDKKELRERVEALESTVQKMMPSRRDAIKMAGAGALGAAAFSGVGSAQPPGGDDGEAGTIGTSGEPVDMFAQDIDVSQEATVEDLTLTGTGTGFQTDGAYPLNTTISYSGQSSFTVPTGDLGHYRLRFHKLQTVNGSANLNVQIGNDGFHQSVDCAGNDTQFANQITVCDVDRFNDMATGILDVFQHSAGTNIGLRGPMISQLPISQGLLAGSIAIADLTNDDMQFSLTTDTFQSIPNNKVDVQFIPPRS